MPQQENFGFRGRDDQNEKDDEESNSTIHSIICFKRDHYKFAFVTKGNCLIYIALSRNRYESVSFLKK